MKNIKISDDIIAIIHEGDFIIIDVVKKAEYKINNFETWNELGNLLFNKDFKDKQIAQKIIDVLTKPNNNNKKTLNPLTRLFHLASKDGLYQSYNYNKKDFALTYLEVCKNTAKIERPKRKNYNDYEATNIIDLPKAEINKINKISFNEILKKRKTVRQFSEKCSISLQDLSILLYSTFGYYHGKEDEYLPFIRRTSPSGGCLQIVECYILSFKVNNLEPSIYYYDPENHKLCKENNICTYEHLAKCLGGQFYGEHCALGIFFVVDLPTMYWKYKTIRNYKVLSLETGHFSQTALLTQTALNMKSWITGAFMDTYIEKLLKINPSDKAVLLFHAVGDGYYDGMHQIMKKVINEK